VVIIPTQNCAGFRCQLARALHSVGEMAYVVKATSPDGVVDRICQAKIAGLRTFGKRESAEIFATKVEAHAAIISLPGVLESVGVSYSVEATD
jgi:hypothetical protein